MTNIHSKERTQIEDDNDNQLKIKLKMYELVKLATTMEDLVNLRTEKKNISMFTSFVNYCLIHLTTSVQGRYYASKIHISDMFTVFDEALCVLIIENHSEDVIRVYDQGV